VTSYIVRRLFEAIPSIWLLTVVVFVVMQLIPGDPAIALMGRAAAREENKAALEKLRREMGLDQPLAVQYVRWFGSLLRGDFGVSNRSGQPVLALIGGRLPATLELIGLSTLLSLLLAVPLGILAALKRHSPFDRVLMVFAVGGVAIPGFWLGLTLILVFSVQLGWLPASGYVPFGENPLGNLQRALMPVLTLSVYLTATFSRFLRSDMIEVLGQDYIRTARAKGLNTAQTVTRHGLKNALIPLWTILGLEVGTLLGGVVIVEQVFGWSGIGWLLIQAVYNQDYPLVQGLVLLIAVAFTLITLLVDVGYAWMNPRIRYG